LKIGAQKSGVEKKPGSHQALHTAGCSILFPKGTHILTALTGAMCLSLLSLRNLKALWVSHTLDD